MLKSLKENYQVAFFSFNYATKKICIPQKKKPLISKLFSVSY